MPRSSEAQGPTLHQQARHVRSEVLVRLVQLGVPWAVLVLVTVYGFAVHVAFGRHYALATEAGTMLAGTVLALLDWHLRGNRMSFVGRWIGPATTVAAAAATTAYLATGFSVPMLLTWMFGGSTGAAAWMLWFAHAPRHDLGTAFAMGADRAGLAGVQLVTAPALRARRGQAPEPGALPGARPLPSRPGVQRARVHLPGGAATPEDAAARVTNLEGGTGYPAGAFSITPVGDGAAGAEVADLVISDPRLLADPWPWPGPSAPGADMSVPFRLGMLQSGEPWLLSMLPLFHTRCTGSTGTGKTMSWLWNRLAEGVTREGYAMVAVDVTKLWQFLGPIRQGLHAAAVDPGSALRLFAALERVRVARLDYLSKSHMTEWTLGCGLSFLDIALEELGEILDALAAASKGSAGAPFDMKTWFTNVRAGRSAGMSWHASNQTGKSTSTASSGSTGFPTEVRGQFDALTFGLKELNDVKTALSDRQREAGVRPTLWAGRPGTAAADFPTMPPGLMAVPLRFWYWGQSPEAGRAIAAYMAEWPAAARPLDDVTAGALAAEPGLPGSYALPGPGGALPGASRPAAPPLPRPDPRGSARDGSGAGVPDNVRQFPGQRPAASPPGRGSGASADAALEVVRRELAARHAAGNFLFTFDDLTKAGLWPGSPVTGPGGRTQRARSWGYNALKDAVTLGWAEEVTGTRKRWRILPAVNSVPGQEQA